MNSSTIKDKKEIKYFCNNKSKDTEREKLFLSFELNDCIISNIYSIKIIYSDNDFKEIKESDPVKCQNSGSSLFLFQFRCDYKFEREQKLIIEITKTNNINKNTYNIQTSIGEIIGNEIDNMFGINIYKLNDIKETLKIKAEKIKINIQFLIFHFTLKITPEIDALKKYEYFQNIKFKIYYIIETKEKKIYESETYTDNGKFNIVQIPLNLLENGFKISFFNYKLNQIGCIETNIKDFINPEKKGHIIFSNRLTMKEKINIYNFSFIREEITFLDYILKGIRIGLNIGIDFSHSNKPTDDPSSLHCLLKEKRPNPYERAILSCAKILEYYDYNKLFPVYGFGAVIRGKYKTSMCFNINFKDDPNIQYVENIIKEYVNCMNKIDFACPTYFAPIIKKIIYDIKQKKDSLDYQLLMILTDGMIQDLQDTVEALVEGSFYPLSVIIIGIGKEDFSKMEKLDGDEIPLISKSGIKRLRDLVQFVPFSKFENNAEKLINKVLEEIPRQIIEYYTFNFLYPENIGGGYANNNNEIKELNRDNTINSYYSENKSLIFQDTSFELFESNKNVHIEKEECVLDYDEVNSMFDHLLSNDNDNDLKVNKSISQKINRDLYQKTLLDKKEFNFPTIKDSNKKKK